MLGALAGWVALQRPLPVAGARATDGFTRLVGVVHVHTTSSDGGGTPEQVVAAAQAAGLDFVAITDHNNLDAKPIEGYHDRLLAFVGTEISTNAGHIVGLGVREPGFRFSGDALDALQDIRDLGGAAFAAHPHSPRADFRYGGWPLPGAWGVELLNGDSQWREAGYAKLALTAALYGINPRYALLQSLTPPAATLAEWDRLLAGRDVPGIVGADAHSRVPIGRRSGLRFPSYAALFGLVRNHVLLERPLAKDAARDIRALVDALAHGRSYLGVDALADASGFLFVAEAGERRATMGDTVAAGASARLRAGGALPAGSRLRLLRDGLVVKETAGDLDAAATSAGVYRVEAYLPGSGLPWIVSNPIYVFPPERAEERAQRAAWPEPPPPPPTARLIEDFEAGSRFAPELDPASAMESDVVVAGAGPDGSRAARLSFRLGEPGPGRPYTWCALVDREKLDLSGSRGLVFWLRGEGIYRLWFQVRDANPASADAGEEWWFASVKTTTAWRRVAVPFERLRSINPRSDGRLDLDKLVGVVFLVDLGAAKPGARGTIWIDDLGVY